MSAAVSAAPASGAPASAASGETSIDDFLGGRVQAVQPKAGRHRSGLEAILIAAAIEPSFTGTVADLGAGAGVAGMAVAARCPGAAVLLVERDPLAVGLARAALARPANAAFARRVSVVETDVAAPESVRAAAGLGRAVADAVVTNPPFHAAGEGTQSPNAARAEAHVLAGEGLDPWLRAAASALKPDSRLVIIFRADRLDALLAALAGRFGGAAILPVHPRAGADAHRVLVTARKGSRAPVRLLPPLVLHPEGASTYLPEAEAILRHGASLAEANAAMGADVEEMPEMAMSLNSILPARFRNDHPVVPVIRLSGAIGASSGFRSGLSLAGIEAALAKAFAVKRAPAVALIVNSPGGAAVQSHLIFKRIRALAEEKHKKVIVVVEDVAASGGYMIAVAGDQIVVDASSIVGSIGVLFAGFGFPALMEKLGIERRVHTAGTSKAMLDPFRPEKEEDVARLKSLQGDVHADFIALVKRRRPSLIDDPDLFTGAFWSGSRAVELGLADRVGDLRTVLRETYGEKVRVLPIPTAKRGWLRRLGGGSGAALSGVDATGLVERAIAAVEERLLWNRFGL